MSQKSSENKPILKGLFNAFTLNREEEGVDSTALSTKELASDIVSQSKVLDDKLEAAGENQPQPNLLTCITEGVVINGSIESANDLLIHGVVNGDVVCKGNITMTGTVVGKVEANSFVLDGGKLEGSIKSLTVAEVYEGHIKGDIYAADIVVTGAIEGNIQSKNFCKIFNGGSINGDITTRSIFVSEDSVICGNIACKRV